MVAQARDLHIEKEYRVVYVVERYKETPLYVARVDPRNQFVQDPDNISAIRLKKLK